MIVDAHHHVWKYSAEEFAWISPEMSVLRRDYLPSDFEQAAAAARVEGAITVHARTSLVETEWLLELAARHSIIKGVVGWVPLQDESIGGMLDRLAESRSFRGAREILQGAPDAEFFDCPRFNRGIRELTSRHLTFDLLIFHHQLDRTASFVDAHPDQRFVLDHIAKPAIGAGSLEAWARRIRELARRPNVFCKFSGVTTEVRGDSWNVGVIRPYFEIVLEAFGPGRLMFGSDWPVCLLRTGYAEWVSATEQLTEHLSASEREAFYSGTARTAYQLPWR